MLTFWSKLAFYAPLLKSLLVSHIIRAVIDKRDEFSLQYFFISKLFWTAGISAVTLSILAFYWRLFARTRATVVTLCAIFFMVTLWSIAVVGLVSDYFSLTSSFTAHSGFWQPYLRGIPPVGFGISKPKANAIGGYVVYS